MLAQILLERLKSIVGASNLLTSKAELDHFGVDRTSFWAPRACAVVRPNSVEQVRSIVLFAIETNLAIVPSGGRTGLSGGAVAANGELVLVMDRLNKVLDYRSSDRAVTVEAGIITANLQAFAEKNKLFYPVDFASSGSSQIGGNIATNAGGIRVLRYGMTRDWVLGLKVVTGAGEILDLNRGLVKNNSGYDLRHLFIGSEGTLGVICEATLQLTQPPQDSTVMVLGLSDFSAVVSVFELFEGKIDLSACEFFSQLALDRVVAHRGYTSPFDTGAPFYVLFEFEADSSNQAESCFQRALEQGWVVDGVISQNSIQAQSLWKLREDISDTLWQWQPYKNDLSVRVSDMPNFIKQVEQLVSDGYSEFELVWYGHVGDGNLHLNILKPEAMNSDDFLARCEPVSHEICNLLVAFGGSISAEHGIGLLKKDYLKYTRSAAEVEIMRKMKKIFDPKGILNPGKVFDE